MIVAVAGLYVLITGKLFKLKLKQWLGLAATSVLPIAAWIAARYPYDGFLFFNRTISIDIVNRVEHEFSDSEYLFCFKYLINVDMLVKLLCVVVTFWLFRAILKNKGKSADMLLFFLWFAVPLVGFSAFKSGYFWYIIPCYYPLFIIAAISIGRALKEEPLKDRGKCKNIMFLCGKFLTVLILVAVIVNGSYKVYGYLSNPISYNMQNLITEKLANNNELRGSTAYTYALNDSWMQRDVFIAELTCDLKCASGGVDAFVNEGNEGDILIINRLPYEEMFVSYELGNFPVVESDENFCVLEYRQTQ